VTVTAKSSSSPGAQDQFIEELPTPTTSASGLELHDPFDPFRNHSSMSLGPRAESDQVGLDVQTTIAPQPSVIQV
jgi:hypothetical protein